MTTYERTGTRDLTYSKWHRNVGGHLDARQVHQLAAIDVDFCEYCVWCYQPLALIEVQRSTARPKSAKVTTALARAAGIEAYSVSFWTDDSDVIAGFKVADLLAAAPVAELTPPEYATWLLAVRGGHLDGGCRQTKRSAA